MRPAVQIVADLPALQALGKPWQDLTARIPEATDFFATWDCVWVYLNTHRPAHWQVIALWHPGGDALAAVFPLQLLNIGHEGKSWRACQPLGVGYVPYIEFPIDSLVRREALQVLLNTVLQQQLHIEVALLWPLHQASPLYLTLLEDLGGSPALMTLRFAANVHEIETRGRKLEVHRQRCALNTFREAEYKARRLARQGPVQVTLCEPPEHMESLIAWLCQLNQRKFGQQHAYRHLPHWSAWVQALGTTLSPNGQTQLSTLRLDGQPIAGALSFVHKGRRSLYLVDCEPQWARSSPTKVLLARLIETTFAEGGVFCFGAGSTDYKRDWGVAVGELKAALVFFNPDARAALQERLNLQTLNVLAAAL